MTRDEYNAAHRRLELSHRDAHRANSQRHGRPRKYTPTLVGNPPRRMKTYAFEAWSKSPAAEEWARERLEIYASFRQAHLDLKAAHPEFSESL